jgi:hypothetical protein
MDEFLCSVAMVGFSFAPEDKAWFDGADGQLCVKPVESKPRQCLFPVELTARITLLGKKEASSQ